MSDQLKKGLYQKLEWIWKIGEGVSDRQTLLKWIRRGKFTLMCGFEYKTRKVELR